MSRATIRALAEYESHQNIDWQIEAAVAFSMGELVADLPWRTFARVCITQDLTLNLARHSTQQMTRLPCGRQSGSVSGRESRSTDRGQRLISSLLRLDAARTEEGRDYELRATSCPCAVKPTRVAKACNDGERSKSIRAAQISAWTYDKIRTGPSGWQRRENQNSRQPRIFRADRSALVLMRCRLVNVSFPLPTRP